METPWVDDKANGIQKTYYKNGKIEQEAPYKDDKINGIVKTYYESGELKEEIFDDDEIPF